MGLLKKIGKGLKKVGGAVTKVASFVPGPVGLLGSTANAAIEHKPIVSSVIGDQVRNSKVGAALLPLAMSGGAAAPLLGGAAGAAGAAGTAGAAGGALGLLKNVGNFALKNPDLLMAGLSGIEGYKSDKAADAMRKRQYDLAMQNWNTTAPLRTQGQSQMLDQSLEALPYAINKYNPFSV
mgnify:FL=1